MLRYLDQHRTPPPEIKLTVSRDAIALQRTLQHLSRYWAQVPPERKTPRRRHTERITVIHEYEEVLAGAGGLFLNSPFVSNEEEWEVENASETGLGAFIPAMCGDWVKVGSLIGVRRDEGASWAAGVVRRVNVDQRENRYVGIEMLANGGAGVTIRSASLSAKGSAISALGELAVLLSRDRTNADEVALLMRVSLFSPSQNLLMHAYDRQYLLRPIDLLERGEEFDLALYRISDELR
jgi:hypothetical protein